ncbi:MAG TPA: hypothetical protein PLB01_00045 [Thermoanaerobaculia bacterium]|nr:hypothetical protein [Thermoanaerobaculia bacterium]
MISQRRAEILATSFAIAGMGTPGRTSAGGVSMSGRILTREEYADAIDMVHATEKRELLERFDVGAERYGILDLSLKDWEREEHEERLDKKAYKIFDWVRKARGL